MGPCKLCNTTCPRIENSEVILAYFEINSKPNRRQATNTAKSLSLHLPTSDVISSINLKTSTSELASYIEKLLKLILRSVSHFHTCLTTLPTGIFQSLCKSEMWALTARLDTSLGMCLMCLNTDGNNNNNNTITTVLKSPKHVKTKYSKIIIQVSIGSSQVALQMLRQLSQEQQGHKQAQSYDFMLNDNGFTVACKAFRTLLHTTHG